MPGIILEVITTNTAEGFNVLTAFNWITLHSWV